MKYSSIDITNGKKQGFHLLNDFIAEAKTGCCWQGRRCPGTSFPSCGHSYVKARAVEDELPQRPIRKLLTTNI